MKVLFTGGSGFVGRNVIPYLRKKYEIIAPTRRELNLLDTEEVEKYIKAGNFDVIIHSANPNPSKNDNDKLDKMIHDSEKCFMNFYRMKDYYKKMYVIGSGAEFDKREHMYNIMEDEFDRSIPEDDYGFAKYIINTIIGKSENIYNLRLFACYGPTDADSKFITHVINSILENKVITIRQECRFDYLHVSDLAKILEYFIQATPKYHDYNISSGKSYLLSEIADMVRSEMKSDMEIKILSPGLNKEYTASNKRLLDEFKIDFLDLREGIKIQIASEKEIRNEKKNS